MRADRDCVGQLAFRRKVSRDVFAVGGYGAKFFDRAFVWIENKDGFPRVFLEIVEWRNEIGIARDKHNAVKILLFFTRQRRCL